MEHGVCCEYAEWCRNLATASGEGEYAEDTTRSTKKTRRDIDLPLRTRNTGSETAAGHTYEYASKKWDKFDVEAALAALSDESDTENKKTAVKGHQSNGERSNPYIQEVHRRKLDPKSKASLVLNRHLSVEGRIVSYSPVSSQGWLFSGSSQKKGFDLVRCPKLGPKLAAGLSLIPKSLCMDTVRVGPKWSHAWKKFRMEQCPGRRHRIFCSSGSLFLRVSFLGYARKCVCMCDPRSCSIVITKC